MYGVWRLLRWLDTEDHGQNYGEGLSQEPGLEQGENSSRGENDGGR
jgi:hypothetical protein